MKEVHKDYAKVFKALADPKRLAIIERLRTGEKCACVLLEDLETTQSGLSYHMKILVESKIVESWQVGKWTHYKLSEAGSKRAIEILKEITTEI